MLLWLTFQLSITHICYGLQIIDPPLSELTAANVNDREGEHNTETHIGYDENDNNKGDDTQHPANNHRLLHHHMINTLDPVLDRDELNEQISILSHKQQQENQARTEHLEKIVNFLQTTLPLSETEHIHTLLQDIVNKTLSNANGTESLADLEILRDYLHQIDNAVDFGKMGGLSIMLQLVLEYPFIEVRASAAWTIGLACQNNPRLMEIAHNISAVQNILYLLKLSSNHHDVHYEYPKINLLDIQNINYLAKLIWTLSALTRQNEQSYELFKQYDGSQVMYDWIMEIYGFWNANKKHPHLLHEKHKHKVIEKVLMFASDVVVLSPEQQLFVDDKWCDVFAAHFNYAQNLYHGQLREITLAYWDVAVHQFFCLNCIPFAGDYQRIENDHLSIEIGLNKLMSMEVEDEFDLEIKRKATQLMNLIQNTHVPAA